MPLQKLPHQGSPSTDAQMTKRHQLQERRRTLQTISELSTTQMPLSDFRSFTGIGQSALAHRVGSPPSIRRTSKFDKRQSMPQYCSKPECIETRSSSPVPSKNIMSAKRGQRHANSDPPPRIEAGWNARRERARMQAELALSGTQVRIEPSLQDLQNAHPFINQSTPSPLHKKSSQPYLKSYYSQQHLLRNSRSLTSTTSQPEQRSNSGRIPRQHSYGNQEIDSSGRASTDSSSYRSSHDSTMRRSRSSSSSQSYSFQDVPPLPSGAHPTRPYYPAFESHYHNGYPIELPGPMYAKSPTDMRTNSLPYVRAKQFNPTRLSHQANSESDPTHRSRPKSLSTHSTSNHHRPHDKTTSRSSLPSQRSRQSSHRLPANPSLSSHPISTPSPHDQRSSSLKQTSPAHAAPASGHHTSPPPCLDPVRPIPSRESLTKWKSEREEAKAEFDVLQRARMKERVRRANEMEREKEKELQAVGLGAEKGARVLGVGLEGEKSVGMGMGKRRGRGCLAGVFWGRRWGRWW